MPKNLLCPIIGGSTYHASCRLAGMNRAPLARTHAHACNTRDHIPCSAPYGRERLNGERTTRHRPLALPACRRSCVPKPESVHIALFPTVGNNESEVK